MIEMKYVIVRFDEGPDSIFFFPKSVRHDYFVESLQSLRHDAGRGWDRMYPEPISAGFTDGVTCYGQSESLDLESRPEDTLLMWSK